MISIITVTLNAASTLRDTMESIVKQTYRDFELVIVDGGSTDGTLELLKEYKPYIGTLISEKDKGIYDAMNKGVKAAKGDILFFLNAQDTLYSPEVLNEVRKRFEMSDRPQIVFGDIFLTNKANYPLELLLFKPDEVCSNKDKGHTDPGICHQCIFYKKSLFDKLGGYDLQYPVYADYDFNIRSFIHARNAYAYIPLTIATFDLGGVSTLRDQKHLERQIADHSVLQKKLKQMLAAAEKKDFRFSIGKHHLQCFGIKLDWSACLAAIKTPSVQFPFSVDFSNIDETIFQISNFHSRENWGRWVKDECGIFTFTLKKRPSAENLKVSFLLYLFLKQQVKFSLIINGKHAGEKIFDPQPETAKDRLVEFTVPANLFIKGKNTLKFQTEGASNPNQDLRKLGAGIQNMDISIL